jgi:hypothetical protein
LKNVEILVFVESHVAPPSVCDDHGAGALDLVDHGSGLDGGGVELPS